MQKRSKANPAMFSLQHLHMRKNASPGLWMIAILPLACSPGLYDTLSQCQYSPRVVSLLAFQVGVSCIHIVFGLPDHTKINTYEKSHPQQNMKKRILTHPYMCPLIFSMLLYYFSNLGLIGCFVLCFMCRELQHRITVWLFRHFSDSFTVGEALLVGQAAALVFTLSLKGILMIPKKYSEYQQVLCFIQSAVLTAGCLGFVLWTLRRKLTVLKLLLILVWAVITGIAVSSALLREWTPIWLFNLLLSSPSKLALIGWWTNLSILILFISNIANRFGEVAQTVWRKAYHLMIILIMIPGIAKDPLFTHLACSGAVLVFLILEMIRYVNIQPISGWLGEEFAFFLDEKDGGSLVLSHIYLLVGLATPLWLCPCSYTNFVQIDKESSNTNFDHLRQNFMGYNSNLDQDAGFEKNSLKAQVSPLALYAGVLTVGIGDAFASIGGTYFGRHRWKGTNKSIEGTVCNILSQVITVTLFTAFGLVSLTMQNWWKFAFGVVLTAFVEAFTDQVDNIVLPLLLYTPLMEP